MFWELEHLAILPHLYCKYEFAKRFQSSLISCEIFRWCQLCFRKTSQRVLKEKKRKTLTMQSIMVALTVLQCLNDGFYVQFSWLFTVTIWSYIFFMFFIFIWGNYTGQSLLSCLVEIGIWRSQLQIPIWRQKV